MKEGKRINYIYTYILYIYISLFFISVCRVGPFEFFLDDTIYLFPGPMDMYIIVIYRILHLPRPFPSRIAIINWPDKTNHSDERHHVVDKHLGIYSAYI